MTGKKDKKFSSLIFSIPFNQGEAAKMNIQGIEVCPYIRSPTVVMDFAGYKGVTGLCALQRFLKKVPISESPCTGTGIKNMGQTASCGIASNFLYGNSFDVSVNQDLFFAPVYMALSSRPNQKKGYFAFAIAFTQNQKLAEQILRDREQARRLMQNNDIGHIVCCARDKDIRDVKQHQPVESIVYSVFRCFRETKIPSSDTLTLFLDGSIREDGKEGIEKAIGSVYGVPFRDIKIKSPPKRHNQPSLLLESARRYATSVSSANDYLATSFPMVPFVRFKG